MAEKKTGGLEGVIAGQTAISTVGKEGVGLTYRGYSIDDLAENASFEEVAHLLIRGKLPNASELESYRKNLVSMRGMPEKLKGILEAVPGSAHTMDVLRTGSSALGTMEPESAENDQYRIAERLLACFPYMLLYWLHFHRKGVRIPAETRGEDLAGHFLTLLHGRQCEDLFRSAVNASLVLYAEH